MTPSTLNSERPAGLRPPLDARLSRLLPASRLSRLLSTGQGPLEGFQASPDGTPREVLKCRLTAVHGTPRIYQGNLSPNRKLLPVSGRGGAGPRRVAESRREAVRPEGAPRAASPDCARAPPSLAIKRICAHTDVLLTAPQAEGCSVHVTLSRGRLLKR